MNLSCRIKELIMTLEERLERVYKDIHIDCVDRTYKYQDVPVYVDFYVEGDRNFFGPKCIKSNVIGKDSGVFLGVKVSDDY